MWAKLQFYFWQKQEAEGQETEELCLQMYLCKILAELYQLVTVVQGKCQVSPRAIFMDRTQIDRSVPGVPFETPKTPSQAC